MRLLGLGLGGAAAGSVLWTPERAEAAPKSRVVNIEKGKRGTTVTMELASAPYPFKGKPYKDATTIAFIPSYFRLPSNRKIDMLVHFHGHGTNARRSMSDHQLREQLFESKQNVVLLMPQGPMNASDGNIGKLGQEKGLLRFLTDARKTLTQKKVSRVLRKSSFHRGSRVGRLALSAHSGGYHAAAMCLARGGFEVKEVYLFDSLYGDVGKFKDWVVAGKRMRGWKKHKLMCFYSGTGVQKKSMKLMKQLKSAGIEVMHEEREGQLTRSELTSGRAIFIRTRLGHSKVTTEHNALRDCLFASGFKRRLRSDWFKESDKRRKVDERR